MEYIVIYSSRTGNTKMVADAIAKALPAGTSCVSVQEAPADLSGYKGVFLGFWADQGNADKEAQKVLKRINNPKIALFATLGVPPEAPHATETVEAASQLLPEPKNVVGTFKCQGKVDPKVIEMMYKMFPENHPHGRNPEREARHKQAASHPNEEDLIKAGAFAKEMQQKMESV